MRFSFVFLLLVFFPKPIYAQETTPLKAVTFDIAAGTSGAIPRIIEALSIELNEPINNVVVPYPRMMRLIETGGADFAIFFASEKSRTFADPLHVMFLLKTSILVKSSMPIDKTKNSLLIASARGVLFSDRFDNSNKYEHFYSNNHDHSIQLLTSGRVDGAAGPEHTLLMLTKKFDPEGHYRILETINLNEVTLQFSKASNNRNRIEDLKKAASSLRQNGKLDALIKEFGYLPSPTGNPKN